MRDELLEFELELDERSNDEVVEYPWGRAFLSPALPLAWDANWALVERTGMSAAEVVAAAEESLAGYAHRAVAIRDEAEGERVAREIEAIPGWEAERNLYMLLEDPGAEAPGEARETPLSGCEELRRELIRGEFSPDLDQLEETADQLLEMGRRTGEAGGDRWFVAPPEKPAAACCLLSAGEIGQVEDVGTLASARGRGLAKAVIRAAIAASREAGHRHTFIVADADDWPRLLYEKLGFEACGVLHVLRKPPTAGTTA
ncbi:MAG TPA: GNAT family N-acetyltransferase [Solirubrobacterales bacterium]|jgi:GNAT superfamily N-acetyltransferase|nr:GNAT family N-acetyltransferase [Solirubrobacterales bacterium]